ncbi:MAG: hypothetical protein LBG82_06080 [Clostridiales Family XIII bacterium]|jgi:cytosine/uracil/thiamine/allantoin permease|nr:hypothetical protein [Clostridiales Family XIII bacterium]
MVELTVEREAVFGTLPIPKRGRRFGFFDAFLILSGYCIATWSYTQGVYLTTLVGFGQLLVGAFFGALLMLLIYQLPVILSVRFGIDIWVYLKTVFGQGGVRLMAVLIIAINFPWYSVCAELFASSMQNLSAVFGLTLPAWSHLPLAALLFADFFIVRRGRFSLRAAFGLPGHDEYSFTRGFNLVGLFCVAAGVAVSLLIYDPVNSIVHIRPLFMLTPTGATFVITAALYCALCRIPRIRRYLFRGEHSAVSDQGLTDHDNYYNNNVGNAQAGAEEGASNGQ